MLKALAIKELRESAGIVAIAMLAVAYALAVLTGFRVPLFLSGPATGIPFVTDNFWTLFVLAIGAMSVALGLKQTAVEGGRGTYDFLLHRPATRRFLFSTKLVVGGGLIVAVGALFILVYAMWAATPGKHASPFFWSMTIPAWQLLLCMTVIYLGAFLSGIRPARWFGTRLLPLAAAVVLAVIAGAFSWWWFTVLAVAALASWIVVVIFFYAQQRDY